MLHRVVHHPTSRNYDLSSLRAISFGGAPTPPETIEKAREVLPIEPSFTQRLRPDRDPRRRDAERRQGPARHARPRSGRPLPILDMKIVDDDGKRAAATAQLGELLIYGPTITPGYWNRPDATAETVRDGWLHTGDLGYRDAEGFFFVVDRAKDMIIRGGENVYCIEIENCLAEHPEIDEAAVDRRARPGARRAREGDRARACPGSTLDADAREAPRRRRTWPRFKVPEIVEFTDEPLPRNPAGKLLKNVLRGTGVVSFATDDLE